MSDESAINNTPFLRDPADYVLVGVFVLVGAYVAAGLVNENVMGNKPALLCDQIRSEFAQAAETMPTLIPEGNTHDVRMELIVKMPANEIGSFIPWAERDCTIVAP